MNTCLKFKVSLSKNDFAATFYMKHVTNFLHFPFSRYYDYVLELLASHIFTLPYYNVCQVQSIEMGIWPLYIKE